MTTKPSTRTRLLDAAQRLFWEQGYHATSVADILREAEANSGSLYNYFKTKQDLLIGVLDRYREGIDTMLFEPVWADIDDPLERVFAVLDGYRQLLIRTDFRLGCPIGNIALEMPDPDPVLQQSIASNFEAWTDGIRRCLDAAADRFQREVDTDAVARFALTTMEGAVMVARASQDIAPFDAVVGRFREYIELLTTVESTASQN